MKKTENTYDRQTAKFIATFCQSIPDMSGDVMQGWIENPKSLQKVLEQALTPPEEETETEQSSLRDLGFTLALPAQPECKVANCFTDKAVFAYRDADFDHWLPETLPATAEVAVSGYELTVTTTEAELAKVGKPFTSPKQIEDLILRTEKGENTGLITNGNANIFLLQVGSSVFTVLARRISDGWGVDLHHFHARYEWGGERRFFSPAT